MRAWRCSKGTLVDLGPTRTAVVNTLVDDLPDGPWRDLHEFQLVESGDTFRVQSWSLGDDLVVCVHAVIDGALKELTLVQHYGREWTCRKTEKIVLDGLELAPDR